MAELVPEWSTLCALVFVLGLKHGFDPDHLACIDGLTRYNQGRGAPFARSCGALFSLGHSLVVMLIALTVALTRERLTVPDWLQSTGQWISILSLMLIGVLNLHAVLRSPGNEGTALLGIKSPLLGKLSQASRPISVMFVGAVFALSFDTVSQAAFFAFAASSFGGEWHVVVLAMMFGAGMVTTDALNGFWISRLIARADQIAIVASRVMSIAISGLSFVIAGLGLAVMHWPSISSWSAARSLETGILVCVLMASSYLGARWLAKIQASTRASQSHVRID